MRPTKLIYYHPNAPAYGLFRDAPRPEVNWDTPGGEWVGIWGYEWANLLGNAVLAHDPNWTFEVWQPDLRADRIYAHTFPNGLVHKLFPARRTTRFQKPAVVAERVLEQLDAEEREGPVILQTAVKAHLDWLVGARPGRPVLGTYHGTIELPRQKLFKLRRNLSLYRALWAEHAAFTAVLPHYSLITYQNNTNLEGLKKIYPGPLRKATMGVDFEAFQPRDKAAARARLGLPNDKKILLTVGRLNPLKQNEQVIEALVKSQGQDFLLAIVGTPSQEGYLEQLRARGAALERAGKLAFLGYRHGDELVDCYNAADLFIMSSTSEGCSVASMEAIACQTPVFSTNTGYIAELLQEHGYGYVTGVRDYADWAYALGAFLSGDRAILPFDRTIAAQDFSWPAIARKFVAAYRQLVADEG